MIEIGNNLKEVIIAIVAAVSSISLTYITARWRITTKSNNKPDTQ